MDDSTVNTTTRGGTTTAARTHARHNRTTLENITMSTKTDKTAGATTDTGMDSFDAYLAELLTSGTHKPGNVSDQAENAITAFIESGEATVTLAASDFIGWTATRRGKDADAVSMKEAHGALTTAAAKLAPDTVYVCQHFRGQSDDPTTLVNVEVAAEAALKAQGIAVVKANESLQRASAGDNPDPAKVGNARNNLADATAELKRLYERVAANAAA